MWRPELVLAYGLIATSVASKLPDLHMHPNRAQIPDVVSCGGKTWDKQTLEAELKEARSYEPRTKGGYPKHFGNLGSQPYTSKGKTYYKQCVLFAVGANTVLREWRLSDTVRLIYRVGGGSKGSYVGLVTHLSEIGNSFVRCQPNTLSTRDAKSACLWMPGPAAKPATRLGQPAIENAPPRNVRIAALAEDLSEREFAELARGRRLTAWAKDKWQLSIPEMRTKILGYKPILPESSALRPRSLASLKTVAVIGIGLWVTEVAVSFISDVRAVDRLAVVTSILPLVGCTTQAAAHQQLQTLEKLDTVLCFIGDGLLLGGATAPVGIIVHLVRAIIMPVLQGFKTPQEPPSPTEMQVIRDAPWQRFLTEQLYAYLYSDRLMDPMQEFAIKLNSSLDIEALAVLSNGAQTIGLLSALSSETVADEEQDQVSNKTEVSQGVQTAVSEIRDIMPAEIVRRQRQLLLNLAATIKTNATVSLQEAADMYNRDFINNATSEEMLERYSQVSTYPSNIGPLLPGDANTKARRLRQEIRAKTQNALTMIDQHLRANPPPIPTLFDIAYVVGQSKGLVDPISREWLIDPQVLSPQAYLKDLVPDSSDWSINYTCVIHTQAIARLLRRQLNETDLPSSFPVSEPLRLREFQLLIAMKHGKIFEDWKISRFSRGTEIFHQDSPAFESIVRPQAPPVEAAIDSAYGISGILGLDEATVQAMLQEYKGSSRTKREEVNALQA